MEIASKEIKYANWLVSHPWLALFTSLIVVILAAAGMSNLAFITDYRVFFSEENPQLVAFENLQNTYTKNDNILYVISPKDGKVFTPTTLASIEQLTEQAWQTPYSIRVDSITNFQHTYAEEDDLIVENLIEDAASLSGTALARAQQIAVNEPLLVNRLISPSSHVTGVNVTVQFSDKKDDDHVHSAVQFSRQLAANIEAQNPNLKIYLTGLVIMDYSFEEASRKDLQTLVPLMFLVSILVLGALLRTFSGTFAAVLIITFAIVTGMGLAGWFGIKLTPASVTAPNIILTLAIANSVHILVTFFYQMRHGADKQSAMIESLRVNLQPIFLTSITTTIGFLSMNFSDAPPFRDLGNIVAMGVMAAFCYAIITLPALMMLLPVRVKKSDTPGVRAMELFGNFVVSRRTMLLWSTSALAIMMIAFLPRNELNDEFVKYFDKSVDFRVATDFATDNLTGIYQIELSLDAGNPGGIADPQFLKHVETFAQWFRQQPETLHVNAITDIFKRLNKNLHGDDEQWYRLPQQRELAAQYLLLYEMSLPYGLDLNNQINVEKSAIRFTATLKSLSSNQLLALEQRAKQWLINNTPSHMHADSASTTLMFAHIGRTNILSMLIGTTIALVIISGILIVAFRSIKIGLISMIPNLVPAAMAFGAWGLMVGEVGLALSVVTGMTLGIIVDDTVHFLSKYLRARNERGNSPPDAVRYAFSTVGTALWVTSLVLIAGFAMLTFSSFKLNSGMGLLTAITIAIALIIDFLLLPPLLMKIENQKDTRHATT